MSPFAAGLNTCQVSHLVDASKLREEEWWLDICDANKIALSPDMHCVFDGRNVRKPDHFKGKVGNGIGAIAFKYVGKQKQAPFPAMGMMFQRITIRIFCRFEDHLDSIRNRLRQEEQHNPVKEEGFYSFITNAMAVPTGPVTCSLQASRYKDRRTRINEQWEEHKSKSFLEVFATCMDKSRDNKRAQWTSTTVQQPIGTTVRVFEGPAAEGGSGAAASSSS